jgi:lysyl-tRNA synthetase class 2
LSQFESQFEEDLYRARLEKLERIADLSASTTTSRLEAKYPNHFRFTTDIPTIRAQFEPLTAEQLEAQHPPVAIAGRLVAIRLQGKAGFAILLQGGQRLQIYVRKDNVGDTAFELYKLLDLGDHIGVEGTLFRTRTNELTVQVKPLTDAAAPITFLAKALLPLPDKYSGLGDIELRYRRRYLDLFTDTGDFTDPAPTNNSVILSERSESKDLHDPTPPQAPSPLSTTEPPPPPTQTRLPARDVFVKRAAILRSIRNFFDTRGYLEVETPMLHTVAGGAAARPFNTHHNALDIPLSLRIAPELYLKRLVVGGLDRVYEINRNFRNEGVSTQHNPEFTMLEFYQAYANYHDLMDLTQELITTVAKEVNDTTLVPIWDERGKQVDVASWAKMSMCDAIIEFWDQSFCAGPSVEDLKDPQRLSIFLAKSALELSILEERSAGWASEASDADAAQRNVTAAQIAIFAENLRRLVEFRSSGVAPGKVIAALFEGVAEPHLIQPTIIYDFPLAVSPLSKVKPDEPDWVERFEFYIGGFEVGNAFSELNDPADQLARFEAQVADKDPESMAAVDEDYVRALGYGLPPTAGEGIGIDRLTMILTGSRSIRDVILFPLMRPHKPTPEQEAADPHGESAE